MVKKIISFVLVALMVMCIVPSMAMAAGTPCSDACTIAGHVAAIGTTHYDSIKAAVDAAQDGDTVVVIKDHEMDCSNELTPEIYKKNELQIFGLVHVVGKAVTVDFNGKTVTANPTHNVVLFSTKDNGNLTLKDNGEGSVICTAQNEVYCLVLELGSSKITIESGSYRLNQASTSLIYSAGDETITINGGNFHLDNVGTHVKSDGVTPNNGEPWIFNASGQNTSNIIVNGGTFNDDILHQYYPFEVSAPKEKALKKNDDGTWTMVDAVAYVNEQHKSGNWYTNEVGYATLEEAIAAAEKYADSIVDANNAGKPVENTVTLLDDCVVNDTLNVNEDMTIALNGKEIIWKDIDEDEPLFDVDAGATLKVPNFTPRVYGYIPEDGVSPASGDKIEGEYNFSRKPGTYTVTWISEGVTVDTNTQTYGTNLSLPAEPTKASATFIGWFTEDGQQAEEDMDFPGKDTTYYARFKENPAPISSGYSGPDLWYIGGNTFGVTTNQVPTSVEIDGVPVSFTMNGNQITVGCIQPGSDWVTVRWGSVSNQRSFTPDANAYCTQTVLPKTGDVSFWAAITEFLGF